MKQKNGRVSLIVSVVFAVLCLCGLFYVCLWLPDVVNSMIDTFDNLGDRANITSLGRTLILIDAYVIMTVAFFAVFLILFLLRTVSQGQVFSKRAIGQLDALMIGCFIEGILFGVLTPYFQLSLCVALAAFLLGLLLRVVVHVIEEAMRIKQENDFTI